MLARSMQLPDNLHVWAIFSIERLFTPNDELKAAKMPKIEAAKCI